MPVPRCSWARGITTACRLCLAILNVGIKGCPNASAGVAVSHGRSRRFDPGPVGATRVATIGVCHPGEARRQGMTTPPTTSATIPLNPGSVVVEDRPGGSHQPRAAHGPARSGYRAARSGSAAPIAGHCRERSPDERGVTYATPLADRPPSPRARPVRGGPAGCHWIGSTRALGGYHPSGQLGVLRFGHFHELFPDIDTLE